MTILAEARRRRWLLNVLLALVTLAALWVARKALLPFLLALALGYLMLPAVNGLDRLLRKKMRQAGLARALAILTTYLLTAGIVALFIALVVPVVVQQIAVLWNQRNQLIASGRDLVDEVLIWYRDAVPLSLQAELDPVFSETGASLMGAVQTGLTRTVGVVTSTVSSLIGLVMIPFWLFYVLHDASLVRRRSLEIIPAPLRGDLVNLVRIVDNVLGAYLRGQLLLCLFVGALVAIGLAVLGVQFPAVLGLIAGVFEILPVVGPLLGLIPALIVALIQEPILGLWTLILFLAIQQIENVLLVPRVSGQAVQLHPAIVIIVLVIGNEAMGFIGMLVAVPLTAIVRDLFKYLYLRSKDDPQTPRQALQSLSRSALRMES